jgi:hypothetical protein
MPESSGAKETELIAHLTPLLLDLADRGRVAVSLGGSRAKNRADSRSDYDFRVYADRFRGPELNRTKAWANFEAAWRIWEANGVRIDGAWVREIGDIDADLEAWLAGKGAPIEYDWTIWGYHLPTDLAHQLILSDADGVLEDWKIRLKNYPEAMRQAVLEKHLRILRYWRADYHYESKVARRDIIFLAGITAKLIHSIMQVHFALNRTYFVGDGWNLDVAKDFAVGVADLAQRVEQVLNLCSANADLAEQRRRLIALVDEVETLVARHIP